MTKWLGNRGPQSNQRNGDEHDSAFVNYETLPLYGGEEYLKQQSADADDWVYGPQDTDEDDGEDYDEEWEDSEEWDEYDDTDEEWEDEEGEDADPSGREGG